MSPQKERESGRERPILMSGPMVRAILDGRRTQTRRVVKLPTLPTDLAYTLVGGRLRPAGADYPDGADEEIRCPYGQPGDRLWVRETFGFGVQSGCRAWANYRAGGILDLDARYDDVHTWQERRDVEWYPSIHMPRWASRLTLEITEVRVERVQEITAGDATAEGLPYELSREGFAIGVSPPDGKWYWGFPTPSWNGGTDYVYTTDHAVAYRELWDSLNAKRGYGWDVNPWVWCLSFRPLAALDTPTPEKAAVEGTP